MIASHDEASSLLEIQTEKIDQRLHVETILSFIHFIIFCLFYCIESDNEFSQSIVIKDANQDAFHA
jgi:hypothetical protein